MLATLSSNAWWIAAVFAALLALQTARYAALRSRPSRLARARVARAIRGEFEGAALVTSLGYRVAAVQPEFTWQVCVDGAWETVCLRPDLVVERGGFTYVADIKTGGRAPDPLFPATRRQLLEYLVATGADGALVVDAEARVVRQLAFALAAPAAYRAASWLAPAIAAALGAAATWALLKLGLLS